MTNQQRKRLEEALEKYNKVNENRLSWWEVEKMIGDLNNRMRIETTIKALEEMTAGE